MMARAMDLVLHGYQLLLSPVLGGQCRFHPTCSVYAREAIASHGAAHGGWLALKRILRCQPFGSAGLDPVPPKNA